MEAQYFYGGGIYTLGPINICAAWRGHINSVRFGELKCYSIQSIKGENGGGETLFMFNIPENVSPPRVIKGAWGTSFDSKIFSLSIQGLMGIFSLIWFKKDHLGL